MPVFRAGDGDIAGGIAELSKLKGIGPATASAVLAAGCPAVPFMSDELLLVRPCLLAWVFVSSFWLRVRLCHS